MSARARNALLGAAGAVALATGVLIAPWEGNSLVAYRDIVDKLTICHGETEDVHPGDHYTAEECDAKLQARVGPDYYVPLTRCIRGFTSAPISLQAAATSAAYNVGVGAICNSTAARYTAAGNFLAACHALTAFNKAGGRVVQGLKNRREYGDAQRIGELELCLEGLPR